MSAKQPKELRVEALLKAAVEEFLEKGYEGASVDAIAKRAGVSKGGLYHHFPNKEMLLMEANRKLSEPIVEMVVRAYSNPSAIEGLSQYIRDYLFYWSGRMKELSFFFLSMSKALESPLLLDFYREYVQQSTAFFVDMYKKAVDLGETDIEDPEAYGVSLMGGLDGVLSYVIVNPDDDVEILAKRVEQVLLKRRREQS